MLKSAHSDRKNSSKILVGATELKLFSNTDFPKTELERSVLTLISYVDISLGNMSGYDYIWCSLPL